MRRRVVPIGLALGVVALAAAGCKNSAQVFQDNNEGGWFSQPISALAKPSWARVSIDQNVTLNPKGPVDANELVTADGRCSEPASAAAPGPTSPAPPAEPTAPADRPVGGVAGDLAAAPMPQATPAAATPNAPAGEPPAGSAGLGGVALGMTECQVVRRAGLPGNINISAGNKGERKVVLTYLAGNWPGIYTFDAGRLKIVDRAPEPPAAAKPRKKNLKAKKPAKPKTATRQVEREYVQ